MNNKKRNQLTFSEKRELEEKLDYLILEKRKEVIERLKIARSYGDLSENSEYDAAKEERAMVEDEILTIQEILREAEIIDIEQFADNIVSIGKTVTLLMGDINKKETYHLVGNTSANIFKSKITTESPVGQAINGKMESDRVEVICPNGKYIVKILEINKTI